MIAPYRKNRKRRKTQDACRLCRYERRWLVERFFAWLPWQRRFQIRWEYYAESLLGADQLAHFVALLQRILRQALIFLLKVV